MQNPDSGWLHPEKLGNLKELLQTAAIGTSVGTTRYCVLLPASPRTLLRALAYIIQPTKGSPVVQVFFKTSFPGRTT